MPAYDYKCRKCDTVVEKFFKYPPPDEIPCDQSEWGEDPENADCVSCGGTCDYYPTFYYNSPAQRFDPVVVHRAEDGTIRYPGRADAPVPEGFQKVELTNHREVRAFERSIEGQQIEVAAKWRETRQKFLDGQLKANREAVDEIARGGAWQGADENGKEITRHGLTPQGLRFLERMREASKARQSKGASATSPAFFLDAFSNNASNRDDYHNEHGGFGGRRGRK